MIKFGRATSRSILTYSDDLAPGTAMDIVASTQGTNQRNCRVRRCMSLSNSNDSFGIFDIHLLTCCVAVLNDAALKTQARGPFLKSKVELGMKIVFGGST